MRVKSYSIDRGFESVTEEPFEKDDRDEVYYKINFKNKINTLCIKKNYLKMKDLRKSLPHVRMINDYQEFSSKISIS